MIKLYIFESVKDALEFERGPVAPVVQADAPEVRPEKPHTYKKRSKCKKCGEPGHRSDTCPSGPITPITDEQIAYIKEQAEAGASVEEIAAKTGLPQKVVRRHW